MFTFNVYKLNSRDDMEFIGSVNADDMDVARVLAILEYGSYDKISL